MNLSNCPTGKLRHASRQSAAKALRVAIMRAANGNAGRRERRSYQCWSCGGWHLTSAPNRRESIVQRLSRTLGKAAS